METKKIQDGAFFLSFVVIRYEQREVQSMAFGNNIKKLRERSAGDRPVRRPRQIRVGSIEETYDFTNYGHVWYVPAPNDC